MHIIYVLCGKANDIYSLMTQASIISLKHFNPEAKVTVVCDNSTHYDLCYHQDKLLQMADMIHVVTLPDRAPAENSRHLKTQLGCYFDFSFIYLDSDTLVCSKLDNLYQSCSDYDIAAVPNNNASTPEKQLPGSNKKICESNSWKLSSHGYYNAGVVFFNTTSRSKAFSEMWHQKWLQSSATGTYLDQPAFNASIAEAEITFKSLNSVYNAQFKRRPITARNAAILHYFTTFKKSYIDQNKENCHITKIESYLMTLTSLPEIDRMKIHDIIDSNSPWLENSILNRWLSNRLLNSKKSISKAEVFWFQGKKVKAVWRYLRTLPKLQMLRGLLSK